MQYDPINGPITAKRWKVTTATLARWKRTGIIPDYRALGEPLTKEDQATEQKLVGLISSGWIKSRTLSRMISSGDRINAMIAARRYPYDPRYHVEHLRAAEIREIKQILDKLTREVGTLLYIAGTTDEEQTCSDVIQHDLRALLQRDYLNTANIRLGMGRGQESRFWAYVRGRQSANRSDLVWMLGKLALLAALLA